MKLQRSLPLIRVEKVLSGLFPEYAAFKGLNPSDLIRCLTAFVFALIQLVMAVFMTASDTSIIESHPKLGLDFLAYHYIFRTFCVVIMFALIRRALRGLTSDRDFYVFLFVGLIYSIEGSFFNPSYYFAFIQILVGVSWFTTLPVQMLLTLAPLCGLTYSGALFLSERLGFIQNENVFDIVVATVIATIGSLIAASFREYWQLLSKRLLDKQLDAHARLIDLGRHLGIICHDMNHMLGVQRMGLAVLADGKHSDNNSEIIERLSKATEHIIRLQKFVLAMSQDDKRDLGIVNCTDLRQTIESMVADFSNKAIPYITIECQDADYFCSPSALSFAVINAVNNSVEANRDAIEKGNFSINVSISLVDGGRTMQVIIRDNGRGFPEGLLTQIFKNRVQSQSHDQANHHGLGLYNIARYVGFQNGTVEAYNESGAVIVITIPQ